MGAVFSNQAQLDLLPGRVQGLFAPAVSATPANNGDAIMQYAAANSLMFKAKTSGSVREFRMPMTDRSKSVTTLGDTGLPSGTSGNVVVVGDGSVLVATALTDSVFVGTQCGVAVVSGNGNVSIGNLTLSQIEACSHNSTGGDASTRKLITGSGNSVWGYVGFTELRYGDWNCGQGSYVGAYSERGDYNLWRGGYAGAHSFGAGTYNGSHNIGDGYEAQLTAEGNHNIGGGYQNLYGCKGDNNIVFGESAGNSLTQSVKGTNLDITTVTSQTNITITGGPGTSYTDMRVVVYDASDSSKPYWGRGDYNHTTGVITLDAALPITITTSDTVDLATIPRSNIHFGKRAGNASGFQKVDAVNSMSFGDDTFCQYDNEVVIGNTSVTRTTLRGDLTCGSINIDSNWINGSGPTNGSVWRNSGNLYITSDTSSITFCSNTNGVFTARLYNDGRFLWNLPTSASPNDNGEACLERTSNTTVTLKMKGSDGTIRSVSWTLS